MPTPVLPDIEALAIWWLTDAAVVTGGVHGEFPTSPTFPLATLVRIGGPPVLPRWLDRATLQLDVWGDTKAEARDTAATALASLLDMTGLVNTGTVHGVVTDVDVAQGLRWFPDPTNEQPRYSCTVMVAAHP